MATDNVSIEVKSKGLKGRSFDIQINGTSFDVVLDEDDIIHVQGKSIEKLRFFPLGYKTGEIDVHYFPFGFGLKIIHVWVNDQVIYSEKVSNSRASKFEMINNEVTKIVAYLFWCILIIGAIGSIVIFALTIVSWLNLIHIDRYTMETIGFNSGLLIASIFFVQLMDSRVAKSWLIQKKDLEEIEKQHSYRGVPFGYGNHEWEDFMSYYRKEDEFWSWKSPPAPWRLFSREGYVIVREGKPTWHSFLVPPSPHKP